ncbi:MAG: transketolase [Candidatus Komeilibacteria bacterium CG_4_10_14_0_2_um_filter_37_10]|uniref:Transketolase n=1 Tax=Candidatus Komeilibacteria bacterium CG_4_10_14_0_2_um_filter_37_10 TaxID=1974470 RepID=A0A2M7VEI8_9BACT|nr:MAG: transketolase [Candidatus Komeilibacteria bacterium CG_4_10_14_0_2_um_filter_37_10]
MRKEFVHSFIKGIAHKENVIFITGDLGFNALEEIKKIMGSRFINAGIIEQSIIGIASGLASNGFQVFCYSIAPFITLRCLEQIKLDVALPQLPVFIIGNGGGYSYGLNGPTHHTLEDLGCLSTLPNFNCYTPAFFSDLDYCLTDIMQNNKPAYLRLGWSKNNWPTTSPINDAPWLKQTPQPKLTVLVSGPLIYNVWPTINNRTDVDLFSIIKTPLTKIPTDLAVSLQNSHNLLVLEEHQAMASLGTNISWLIHQENLSLNKFTHRYALGYPHNLYGDQEYHQNVSGLDQNSLDQLINALTK